MNTSSTDTSLIGLDADGVLIDYHAGYAMAWEKAFGERLKVRNPNGYHPRHYWDVPTLDTAGRLHLLEHGFTREVWGSMPAMPGAVDACKLLRSAGYRLTCVTALNPDFGDARAANLRELGFQLEGVHAVGASMQGNPKSAKIHQLQPVAFIDDYLKYLSGLPAGTWRALIEGRPDHSPNRDPALENPDSRHLSLFQFAVSWLARAEARLGLSKTDSLRDLRG